MAESKQVTKSRIEAETGTRLVARAAAAATTAERRGSHKVWLFGAYTLLLVWGVAYLVLLFTDKLPS
ncbi:MAG: hypothetical protein JSU87_09940 [Gemmatimonadota bacterium]|nr:MAG: hypothetical protein JSU87_09940 [Gemmatimonadota bacterium]